MKRFLPMFLTISTLSFLVSDSAAQSKIDMIKKSEKTTQQKLSGSISAVKSATYPKESEIFRGKASEIDNPLKIIYIPRAPWTEDPVPYSGRYSFESYISQLRKNWKNFAC